MVEFAQRQRRRWRLRSGSVGFDLPGGPCALDGGVGVGVQDGGEAGVSAVVAHLQRTGGRHARVVAEGNRLTDQQRVDFVDDARSG